MRFGTCRTEPARRWSGRRCVAFAEKHGAAQRQAKSLLRDDLFAVLAAMGDGLKDARDRAFLLIGFAGGFRRRESTAINCTDVERVRQGSS